MSDPYNSVYAATQQGTSGLSDASVTTTFELPGCRIVRSLGVVRGITVRSRSIVGNFLGGIQTLFGGNITIYTELCEQARHETYQEMLQQARRLGANGIIGMRYDATEIMTGLTEVLCYGTAVVVEPHGAQQLVQADAASRRGLT
ncbi:YbjQ family protein [Pseudoxanthomonas sp. UTMC 1351]|uniref:YbjQ family protein n=1 Tax=Pseudoxanthomonas sp. UTMC 1351 TaxID=2695853 RepID=UPI0034CE37C4